MAQNSLWNNLFRYNYSATRKKWLEANNENGEEQTHLPPKSNEGRKEAFDLTPWKDKILEYSEGHTIRETKTWLGHHYGIRCGETTVGVWLRRWKTAEKEVNKLTQMQAINKPVTPALTDVDMIVELKSKGYRIFREDFVKRAWGNSYKKKLVEL